jgi:hypothetical protein
MKTQNIKTDGSELSPEPNKVKACAEIGDLKKIISWQIGFAVEGILHYRRLGLSEMVAWNRGRLVSAKVILGSMEFDRHEAFKAYASAASFDVDEVSGFAKFLVQSDVRHPNASRNV